ncbi:protein DEHYDRATION-INDUCED 19 homolog 4 [Selaginella moellendorffii]|uniref:protein DEHYDRATION-INDUCED 19 homolog 4 n=1 Tax=Selaginella moellendorffii TaxID=88036 RepID=UPI000D1CE585|nr:protein DEHYDRATION-INDUCED 19 homolog 4 [Selaginella moellendorffii]|eukprot:XP_024522647.1 protein DEHYDRATION-INDUCED 19 homolog 4 [Selaginella moellendorffii]
MEAELWSSRIASSKRAQLLQASQSLIDRQLNTEDLEVDEDFRTDFACPYCEEEFDITSLCLHLEIEHCFDGKLTMCPVCAARVGDVIGHINSDHAHLKRRRLRKPKDIAGNLQALLGAQVRASDSFLLSLVSGFPTSEPEVLKSGLPFSVANLSPDEETVEEITTSSGSPSLSSEEKKERTKEASSRALFAQHLVLSTLWREP